MSDPENSFISAWRLDVLARRRGLLFWTAVAVLVAGVAFVLGLPDVYRTSATLLVERAAPEVSGDVPADPGGRLQVIKQQALGRTQLGQLIDRFELYPVTEGTPGYERAIAQLRRDVRVEPMRDQITDTGDTIAFRVSYVGPDPETAADVTNAIAAFFVEQNDQLRSGQSSRALEILEAEMAATRQRLEQQEAQVRSYSARNLGALPQQVESNLAAIGRLDAQLRMNSAEQLRLMERRQAATAELAAIESQVPAATDLSLSGQLARLEAELTDMRSRFGPEYPDIRALEARIATVRGELTTERERVEEARGEELSRAAAQRQAIEQIDAQLARLQAEDAQLRERIGGYERRVETVPANAPVFEGLMRDYQATRDRLDVLQRRYDEARLSHRAERGGVAEQFQVLDPAVAPAAAAGPSRMLLIGLTLAFAVICGLAVAIVADRLDTTFHSVDDLRAYTSVPVLASVPVIGQRKEFSARVREAALTGAGLVVMAAIAGGAFYLASTGEQISRVLSRVL